MAATGGKWDIMAENIVKLTRELLDCYAKIDELQAEVSRLKAGTFTEEEFQNLCHTFSEDDACRFRAGCEAYQKKLFGEKTNG